MAATQPIDYVPFSLSIVPDRDAVNVVPAGELDLACVDEFEREVRELISRGFDHVVIDLRDVVFADSSALRMLLTMRHDAKRDGHRLTLIPGPSHVQRLFDLTATRALFDWR